MEKRKIAFHTLGCKLNYAETSTIMRMFPKQHFEQVSSRERADIYIIHSCSVTANAEKKTRAAARHARKLNPDAQIAIIGCYPQLRSKELEEMPEVNIILGNREKYHLPGLVHNEQLENITEVAERDMRTDTTFKPAFSKGDRTRSFLKIQDGCDYMCAYCTIPEARGRSRSNSVSEVINTAQEIANSEIKEVILTGVNIGDFGKHNGESFLQLLQELDKIDGIERYRISSIEPDLLSKDIINFIKKSKKFLPHFHIPLQSGNNEILRRMGRRYRRELLADHVNYIKKVMPDACIAIDLIVGFPGETKEQFLDSADFIKSLPVSYLHVFTYSSRPNTKAELMKDKVPGNLKKERSDIMHEISDRLQNNFIHSQKGKTEFVLWESNREGKYMQGWTGNYLKVKTPYNESKVNTIENVLLKEEQNGSFIIE
ncbi:MAG: tRNA (N(6)-L-threonylcarbamoyladenosine(37)-C(2))-methylthiotransferase MtaB [Bacteroidales bacterium]